MQVKGQSCAKFLRMINPFAKLKIPKVDTAAGEDAKGCGNSTIFVPIVESDWWANKVIAGVKRKNISCVYIFLTQDSSH